MTKRRNPLGNLAILGKGGVHMRAKSAIRATEKRALVDDIDAWYEEDDRQPSDRLDGPPGHRALIKTRRNNSWRPCTNHLITIDKQRPVSLL